ncbi:MAG: GNAT family N-acetyltransferase [Candidatus Fermentibacteraceae bacterium]|nr:GNAT family N-acetyltransferase [Candidatus Fermentibacteraceae bacterium]MBN2609712.1 GNAT family N-acetyltransferase [Candidatus Fermentibacteraceae bacterium]
MSGVEVRIRNMEFSDYRSLIGLWEGFSGNTLTGADSQVGFGEFLERNRSYCFVAELDRAAVGSVMAGYDSRRGYIYHLAVDGSLQGRGIGRMLMEAAEDALRNDGVEKAHLFIYTDNPAIEFYERTGWHRRTDIVVMSKVLIGDEFTGTRRDD